MKNYELLDIIGEANGDYVEAADGNVARPRLHWRTLAACAACAALVLGAYPAYQAANPPLHDYVVMEGNEGGMLRTGLDEAAKAPAGGPAADSAPEATMEVNGFAGRYEAGAASIYNEQGEEGVRSDVDGTMDRAPTQDIPVQEAALWYDALVKTCRLDENPEWYGGAWIAGERLLAVAIVDGFRTPELESEIKTAAGDDAVIQFSTVKYSMEFLYGLMEPASRALDGVDLYAGVGVNVMDNCLDVDLYSSSAAVPNSVLAALAHLDPDGDAIRVRVFAERLSVYDEAGMKDPAADSKAIATPGPRSEQPVAEESAAPGGVTGPAVSGLPQAKEQGQAAHYDVIYGESE